MVYVRQILVQLKHLAFVTTMVVVASSVVRAEVAMIPQNQVRDYVLSLFVTPEMKRAATTPGNRISDLLNELSKRPLFIDIPAPEDKYHRENFTAYFGVLNVRNFKNKIEIINDLYFVHELLHIVNMPYQHGLNSHQWHQKMTSHEQDISFATEIAVFFEFPEFRRLLTIPTIYVDRYLNDPKIQEAYRKDPQAVYRAIRAGKDVLQFGPVNRILRGIGVGVLRARGSARCVDVVFGS